MEKEIMDLIKSFNDLPGIDKKIEEKIVFNITGENISNLKLQLNNLKSIIKCSKCNAFSKKQICNICSNNLRNSHKICVVANDVDLFQIEEKQFFNGIFFVLGKEINPRKGVGPENLNLELLEKQVNSKTELIIATNFTIEGELTAKYLKTFFQDKVKKIYRLSIGIPVGSRISYIDELTLKKSFSNRKEF